jgi:GNAT superfamily N-acetyltransferase
MSTVVTFRCAEQHGAGTTAVAVFLNGRRAGHTVLRTIEGRRHMIEFELRPEFRGKGLSRTVYKALATLVAPLQLAGFQGPRHEAYDRIWARFIADGSAIEVTPTDGHRYYLMTTKGI